MQLLDRLTDKEMGERRPIEDFLTLFILEIYTSGAGAAASMFWFLWSERINSEISKFIAHFVTMAGLFTIVFFLGWYYRFKITEEESDEKGNNQHDRSVRRQIIVLSSFNTILFGALLFLTGGAMSALLPLYAMTFTLTISEVRTAFASTIAFLGFSGVFVLASAYWWVEIIPAEILVGLNSTTEFYFMFFVLSAMSLFVPYSALLYARSRLARRRSRALG